MIDAGRFMVRWYAARSVTIDGGSRITTAETAFMCKAVAGSLTVDGSAGASVTAGNGVIFQLMDIDRPGGVTVSGKPWKTETIGTYTEPTGSPTGSSAWATTSGRSTDARASITDIKLKGDFCNAVRAGQLVHGSADPDAGVITARSRPRDVDRFPGPEPVVAGCAANPKGARGFGVMWLRRVGATSHVRPAAEQPRPPRLLYPVKLLGEDLHGFLRRSGRCVQGWNRPGWTG